MSIGYFLQFLALIALYALALRFPIVGLPLFIIAIIILIHFVSKRVSDRLLRYFPIRI